ncbi:hypothetical protein HII12_001404 [Brettanomyces bruxellensis]|uniref:Uncharacterized protein n=1 Tax=Dekkera bruxellensis TaxID=5007 RepID=A0A8H6EXM6_DEKBR|nr:hypothetical protein HII12_001404 [Brettanomyces bruxellensis]
MSGKVIIVTGASRGMGQAIARLIIQKDEGSKVVLAARSKQLLEKFPQLFPQDERENVKSRTLVVAGDLTQASTVKRLVKETIAKFGGIDSVIFNAGVLDPVGHVADIDTEKLRKLFDINFFSIVQLLQEAIPQLRKSAQKTGRPSSCVFVSSGASLKSYDGWMAYGASKAAVNHVALDVSVEESPLIRTASVAPGVVDTDMQVYIRNVAGLHMKPEALKRFTDLYEKHQLLPPQVPGSIYANLALRGIPDSLNGKYVRYSDSSVAEYLDTN